MKYVKMLGLAAVAAAALMAFIGAGTASAAELYSTGVTVNAGTKIEGSLESGTTATLSTTDGKTIVDTCTGSSVNGTVNAYTGGDVTGAISSLTWSGCSVTTDTLTNGNLSINASGTVSGNGSVVTVNTGVTCRYGTGAGTALGTLTTGKLAINAVINEQEPKAFLCPDTTKWVANYTVTSPHDLTVK
jgi:opacity protein-like surface antigen